MGTILRTPDERFADLPGYPFAPNYRTIEGFRIHFVDEGPRDGPPALLLHGEPSWSYLYRKLIPRLAAAGHRVVAPDLLGFGRSDKPADGAAYTYPLHVAIIAALVRDLGLADITLFGQDWGGLIGLRVVAAMPERFARIVVGNTALPSAPGILGAIAHRAFKWEVGRRVAKAKRSGQPPSLDGVLGARTSSRAFLNWAVYSQAAPDFAVGTIVSRGTVTGLTPEVAAAYDAPFPSDAFKAGARAFPLLVTSDLAANNRAWRRVLSHWHKPLLTTFSDSDPITRGLERDFLKKVPGARGQPHVTVAGAGHFLQEDKGEELADIIAAFARLARAES